MQTMSKEINFNLKEKEQRCRLYEGEKEIVEYWRVDARKWRQKEEEEREYVLEKCGSRKNWIKKISRKIKKRERE